jgi:hypothetical protein
MARGLQRTLARAAARNAGTQVSKAGLTANTTGSGGTYQTVLTFKAMPISVLAANDYASQKIFDFPAGKIRIKGGTASLAFAVTTARASTINDSAAMDWSVGTVAASSVTLATTMVDIIAKQDKTLDGAVAAYTTAQAADVAAAATHDGTSTAIDAYLNVSFPTEADIDGNGTVAVNGTITILWEAWGDNA